MSRSSDGGPEGGNGGGFGGGFGSGQYGQSFTTGVSYGEPQAVRDSTNAQQPVKDITTAQFKTEVIDASMQVPVLVDFWAPWCGPCKQLAPVLEKVVAGTRGAVRLVKMNIDDHPQVAGQMGIQSIPAVVAFSGGKPKDAFMGAQSESEIRRFIEKLVGPQGPSPVDAMLEEADRLAAQGAVTDAAGAYAAVLQAEPDNVAALAGMGSLYLEMGEMEQARAILAAIAPDKLSDPRAASLRSAIELAEQAAALGDAGELTQRIEADARDWDARFDLALILNAKGMREEAAGQLLAIIRGDRKWRDDGARTQLLQFFEAWGMTDPATLSARRQLSALLFS